MALKETNFGHVDRDALENLRSDYDTMKLLEAVDRLDQARHEMKELREQLMALHGMAAHVLRDNVITGPETDAQDIHELVDIVDSGGFDMIEVGEAIQACCDPLRALDSEEALAAREGWDE